MGLVLEASRIQCNLGCSSDAGGVGGKNVALALTERHCPCRDGSLRLRSEQVRTRPHTTNASFSPAGLLPAPVPDDRNSSRRTLSLVARSRLRPFHSSLPSRLRWLRRRAHQSGWD